jgi:S-sulfo-L-cysteine synthase (O-acetyl-L-serine-dependent)
MSYPTIDQMIGNTPLVRLQRQDTGTSTVLAKLEGNNPAGSVKDRPALSMIAEAERRGDIRPGDTLIEATSGNTGIALAMVAAIKGYNMVLVMPESASEERKSGMAAYGAELVLTPADGGMESAIDTARALEAEGRGRILDQFGNPDNPRAHYTGTGPEIWRDTGGGVTHFVASMGTTGTIMGTGRYLKEKNSAIQIVGVQPEGEAKIPGTRAWPPEYLPAIYEPERVDRIMYVTQEQAEETARRLAREEGIFAGISSGSSVFSAVALARELDKALVVAIICDRGDRYLSTGVFPPPR